MSPLIQVEYKRSITTILLYPTLFKIGAIGGRDCTRQLTSFTHIFRISISLLAALGTIYNTGFPKDPTSFHLNLIITNVAHGQD